MPALSGSPKPGARVGSAPPPPPPPPPAAEAKKPAGAPYPPRTTPPPAATQPAAPGAPLADAPAAPPAAAAPVAEEATETGAGAGGVTEEMEEPPLAPPELPLAAPPAPVAEAAEARAKATGAEEATATATGAGGVTEAMEEPPIAPPELPPTDTSPAPLVQLSLSDGEAVEGFHPVVELGQSAEEAAPPEKPSSSWKLNPFTAVWNSFTSKKTNSENTVLTQDDALKIAKEYKKKTFNFTGEVASRKDFYAAKYQVDEGPRVGVWDVSGETPKQLNDYEVLEKFSGGYELAKKVAFHDQSDINELVKQHSLTININDIQKDIASVIQEKDIQSISEKLLKHKVDLLQNIELAKSTIQALISAELFLEDEVGLKVTNQWIGKDEKSDISKVIGFLGKIHKQQQLPSPEEMIGAKILEEADINPERLIAECKKSLSQKHFTKTVTDYKPLIGYYRYAKAKSYLSFPTHFVNTVRLFLNVFGFIANNTVGLLYGTSSVDKDFYINNKGEYVKNLTTLVEQINKLKNDVDKQNLQNIVVPLVREYAGNFNTSKVDTQIHEKLYFAIRNMDPQNKLSLYSTDKRFAIGDKDNAKLPIRRTYSRVAFSWENRDTLQVEKRLIDKLHEFRITPENVTSPIILDSTPSTSTPG